MIGVYNKRVLGLQNSTNSPKLNKEHNDSTPEKLVTLREEKQIETTKILTILMHHKSGTHLGDALIDALHLERSDYIRDSHFPSGQDKDSNFLPWRVSDSFEHRFYNNSMKVIHFVRDPWDILVSAYNYHMSASELWLLWGREHITKCPNNCFVDCLRSLNMKDGIVAETNFMFAGMKDMVHGFQVFQRWPERAINICMSEWGREFPGTVRRLCDFIGHDRCNANDVEESMLRTCKDGNCNVYAADNKHKIECRPIKVIGNCDGNDDLQQCVWEHEITNTRKTEVTCCFEYELYAVNCYTKPTFIEASLSDVREAVNSTNPELFDELELWSKLMGCHNTEHRINVKRR